MDILINLLPPERKEEIKNLRYIGVVLKIGISAIFALVVLASFSYACLYFVEVEKRALEQEIVRFQQNEAYKEAKIAQESLREYDQVAGKIKSGFKKKKDYWDFISEVNSIIPDGLILNDFEVSEDGEIIIKGLAYTRAELLEFKAKLEKSELIQDVESPISNLVTEKDISFELQAKIK